MIIANSLLMGHFSFKSYFVGFVTVDSSLEIWRKKQGWKTYEIHEINNLKQ